MLNSSTYQLECEHHSLLDVCVTGVCDRCGSNSVGQFVSDEPELEQVFLKCLSILL